MKSANTGKPSRTNLAKLKKRSDSEIDVTGTPYNAHSAQDVNRFWENATVMPPRLRGQRGPQRTPTRQIPASQRSKVGAKTGALGHRLRAKGKPVAKRA